MTTIRAPLNTPDKETVYSPDGEAIVTTRLNAVELVRYNSFTWKRQPTTETAIPEAVLVVAEDPVDVESFVRATEVDIPTAPVDPDADALEDVAEALIGTRDVHKYLESFSADALRTIAEKRYNERIHHRTSKQSMIEKILLLEASKISAESSDE
jgi:hypothetical protein